METKMNADLEIRIDSAQKIASETLDALILGKTHSIREAYDALTALETLVKDTDDHERKKGWLNAMWRVLWTCSERLSSTPRRRSRKQKAAKAA